MTFKDKLKFSEAKILRRETILFSKKDDWENSIKNKIKESYTFFYEFNEVNPKIFDLVVPLSLHAQKYANKHPGLLSLKKAIIPSDYCIDLCANKETFHEFMMNNNFGMLTPKINVDLGFPYILKKKTGAWGVDMLIIHSSRDELDNLEKIQSDEYFRQEFISGKEEYATHIVISNKKIMFQKTLKHTFKENFFIYGDDYTPITHKEVDHSHYKQLFESILIAMDYQGICCFDYKIVNQGLMIFEINPRYGGSMTNFIGDALHAYRDAISQIY